MMKQLLFVALDYEKNIDNLAFAKQLSSVTGDYGFKINLDSMARLVNPKTSEDITNYDLVQELLILKKPVFADFKMWNGARTMSVIAKQYSDAGVSIINMYPQAPLKHIQKVKEALTSDTKLLCMTVYTHLTEENCKEEFGRSIDEQIIHSARKAKEAGADGLIMPGSGLRIDYVKESGLYTLIPGVRPAWYENKKANDQEQESLIEDVGLANSIVCGSPIRKSVGMTQCDALERILNDIASINAN